MTDILTTAGEAGRILLSRGRLLLLIIALFAISLYVLGGLVEEVAENEPFSFDEPILLAVFQQSTAALDRSMLWLSGPGQLLFSYLLPAGVVLLLLARRQRRKAAFAAIATLGAMLLVTVVKLLLQRTRPDLWTPLAAESTFSFPSGHATGSACAAITLFVVATPGPARWLIGVLAALIAFLIAFSRIYLGVHYPSDVLGGWAMALGWTSACWMLVFRGRIRDIFTTEEGER